MVVSGAKMDVASIAVVLAAQYHQHLGVGLVADHAIHHVGSDLFKSGGDREIGFLVEARHQFHDDGDLLALSGGAQQVFHQHRVGSRAVHRHLDRHHLRIIGRLLQELDDRPEGLEWVVHQDVILADAGKDVIALGQHLGQAGLEWRVHQVGTIDLVRHRHQAHQVDDARDPVQVIVVEAELLQQESRHDLRAVVCDFQAHAVAEVALRQFALQRDAKVLDFFVVDEQVRVARDAELVAAQHVHARE